MVAMGRKGEPRVQRVALPAFGKSAQIDGSLDGADTGLSWRGASSFELRTAIVFREIYCREQVVREILFREIDFEQLNFEQLLSINLIRFDSTLLNFADRARCSNTFPQLYVCALFFVCVCVIHLLLHS